MDLPTSEGTPQLGNFLGRPPRGSYSALPSTEISSSEPPESPRLGWRAESRLGRGESKVDAAMFFLRRS